jgi:hypothetical protein
LHTHISAIFWNSWNFISESNSLSFKDILDSSLAFMLVNSKNQTLLLELRYCYSSSPPILTHPYLTHPQEFLEFYFRIKFLALETYFG